jgi:hypothetical protein
MSPSLAARTRECLYSQVLAAKVLLPIYQLGLRRACHAVRAGPWETIVGSCCPGRQQLYVFHNNESFVNSLLLYY